MIQISTSRNSYSKAVRGIFHTIANCAMDASSFYTFVLPLWIIVMTLVCLVYYYANREERAQKKMAALIRKHEEDYNTEIQKLEALRQEKTIDRITYERMKHILDTNIEKKREENQEKLSQREKQENQS